MDKLTVMMAVTNNLIFCTANIIIGIEKNNPNLVNEYVIFLENPNDYDSSTEISALKTICNKKINIFNCSDYINEILNLGEGISNFINKWSVMPLLKLMIPNLFVYNESKLFLNISTNRVLWLDADILVKGDITSILKFDGIAGAWGKYIESSVKNKDILSYYSINPKTVKPNGGVLYFSLNVFKNISINKFNTDMMNILSRLINSDELGIEELAWSIYIYINKLKFNILPSKFNFLPYFSKGIDPCIVHSIGSEKFWNDRLLNLIFVDWEINNRIWLSILLKQGVDSIDISKYNHSIGTMKLYSTIVDENKNNIFWKKFILDLGPIPDKIFLNPNLSKRYIQYYFAKYENIKNFHLELVNVSNKKISLYIHLEGVSPRNDEIHMLLDKLFSNIKNVQIIPGQDILLTKKESLVNLYIGSSSIGNVKEYLVKIVNLVDQYSDM